MNLILIWNLDLSPRPTPMFSDFFMVYDGAKSSDEISMEIFPAGKKMDSATMEITQDDIHTKKSISEKLVPKIESTTSLARALLPLDLQDQVSHVDIEKDICILCRRKFSTTHKLFRHCRLSEMHKQNLNALLAGEKSSSSVHVRKKREHGTALILKPRDPNLRDTKEKTIEVSGGISFGWKTKNKFR